MAKLKVMTVVGTRPEIIRLSRVIARLDEHCDHMLVHTGQNYDYELSEIFFDDLGIRRPDAFLGAAGKSGVETIGRVLIAMDELLQRHRPDALLVLGDTNSCMAVVAAKRHQIPTFHMEAGNRCFDMRVPEEINRRIVDHTADVNLTYSTIAREYLLREGLRPDLVIKTGSPMREVLEWYGDQIRSSTVMDDLGLSRDGFVLVSAHREENVDSQERLTRLVEVINATQNHYRIPVIVSTHPRTRKRLDAAGIQFGTETRLLKPLAFTAYNALQVAAKVVLSDSGTITEESSILNFRALNIREAHERPEGMEEGSVMMVGLNPDRVIQALSVLDGQGTGDNRTLEIVTDYDARNVSEKVVRIILSYVDYVNRVVWGR